MFTEGGKGIAFLFLRLCAHLVNKNELLLCGKKMGVKRETGGKKEKVERGIGSLTENERMKFEVAKL
jgi:hypothetical protein